jgi:cyclohexanone monooxygenase
MHSHGFPNCFVMGPQQGGFTVNFPHLLDEQARHIAHIVKHAIDNDVRTIEATADAEQEWVDIIIDKAVFGREFQESCTPGYYNNEGQVGALSAQNGFYGGGNIEFFGLLRAWREQGEFEGLDIA